MVTDSANNFADVYTLGGSTGSAPRVNGPTSVATGSVPDGVAMDGNFAFVANEGGNSVRVIEPTDAPHPSRADRQAPQIPRPHAVEPPAGGPLPAEAVGDRRDVWRAIHHRTKLRHR